MQYARRSTSNENCRSMRTRPTFSINCVTDFSRIIPILSIPSWPSADGLASQARLDQPVARPAGMTIPPLDDVPLFLYGP